MFIVNQLLNILTILGIFISFKGNDDVKILMLFIVIMIDINICFLMWYFKHKITKFQKNFESFKDIYLNHPYLNPTVPFVERYFQGKQNIHSVYYDAKTNEFVTVGDEIKRYSELEIKTMFNEEYEKKMKEKIN